MKRNAHLCLIALYLSLVALQGNVMAAEKPTNRLPNIVIILADDLGYGDLGCQGATKVKTPNVDRLAALGLRFTDAHAGASTCTPSRYTLLTGQYAWRRKGTGVLPGDTPLIIEPGRPTLPAIMQQAGYATGCVGKWHLGLGSGNLDWNGDIKPGPLEIGFNYCFIMPATGDRVPCVFVENHRIVGLESKDPIQVSYKHKVGNEPTGEEHPEMLRMKLEYGHADTIVDGISRIGFMSGGKAARWKDEDIADVLTGKATTFIEKNKDRPFFLYFATHDIHVPRVPHPRFSGTSQCGVRGDVIQQLDWSVGQVMATLDRLNLADDTLLIVTSDNGPVVIDGYLDGADRDLNGHTPAGPLRGGKYKIWEGGSRVPFLARWPARIKPGVSDALLCQVDLLAACAALAGRDLPADAGPDSFNVLPALLGETRQSVRNLLVEQRNAGDLLGFRDGNWKLIVTNPTLPIPKKVNKNPEWKTQLYDLGEDLAETKNVANEKPETVKKMTDLLKEACQRDRTRP